jgi:hypothetical protein
MSSDHTMTRRRALAVTAGAAAAAAMPERASALAARAGAARTAGGFLSPHELTLLDEIAELIIPADAQSGGARTAKCAQYIDARLLQASRIERQKLMERISRNEKSPKENVEHSFVTIKWWVAEAYYTSEIGIHDELKYRGNVFIDEFIGTDVSKSAVEPKTPTK